ncbi:hypothetical protein MLD38_003559 [Melastoma candidum]|uniref:Uncharacterized protein n=1 Tax=Melastoma candidum TaxID=119954 RepID=A0ACB9S272_9MYRT|nr:hypothetical protein MLD38_003559 [Melastoma candidum]
MGNSPAKLTFCFSGGGGSSSPFLPPDLSVDPLDEGLGHSFCYVRPDSLSEDPPTPTPSWAISGASVSANTSTPPSTSLLDLYTYGCVDKSSTFESSTSFSSIPLQPIPRGMLDSGPLSSGGMDRVPGSGPLDRGFLSGPLQRGFLSGPLDRGIFSGPLENGGGSVGKLKRSFSHRVGFPSWRRARKRSLMKSIRKAISKTIYGGQNSVVAPIKATKEGEYWLSGGAAENKGKDEKSAATNGGSLNLSSEVSVVDGVQWAQGKAGEDRVHVVVSDEHGWVFVGIYDGFNGPDAPNYLLSNLYTSIHRELRGLLYDVDKSRSCEVDSGSVMMDVHSSDAEPSTLVSNCSVRRSSVFEQEYYPTVVKEFDPDWRSNRKRNGIPRNTPRGPARKWEETQRRWKCEWDRERVELDHTLKEELNQSGSADGQAINHSEVLKALSCALKKTEEDYLQIADVMVFENPELALMGSCVLAFLMKGEDVYVMNVGDSRAVLAQKAEPDYRIGKVQHDLERIKEETLYDIEASDWDTPNVVSRLNVLQLSVDHSTSIEEEIQRIKGEHPDDSSAISNDRVKGSLKVTRAFGAGFLKQPRWNNALLEMFRIDYVGSSPYISCTPSLYHHRLGPRDKFIILSSDGLYQYFTNEEAVSEVELFIELQPEGDPAQHLVEEVLFRAAKKAGMEFHDLLEIPQGDRRRYHDDISIIIISLEGRIWRSCV